jgi:integrase
VYLRNHLLPILGEVRLDRLTTETLDRLYAHLRDDKGLSKASIHKAHNVVSRALGQATKWEWVGDNVARNASPPAIPRQKINAPTPEEVRRLISVASEDNLDFGTFLRLAAVSGARRGELCALRWSDVDFDRATVEFARAMVIGGGAVTERGTKTGNTRRVGIDPGTVDALRDLRKVAEGRAEACGITLGAGGFVFTHKPDGSVAWRPDNVTTKFARLRTRLGIKVSIHGLRHYSATRALNAGIPLRTVSGRLGHSRSSTTSDIYSQWATETDAVAAGVLGDLLDGE